MFDGAFTDVTTLPDVDEFADQYGLSATGSHMAFIVKKLQMPYR